MGIAATNEPSAKAKPEAAPAHRIPSDWVEGIACLDPDRPRPNGYFSQSFSVNLQTNQRSFGKSSQCLEADQNQDSAEAAASPARPTTRRANSSWLRLKMPSVRSAHSSWPASGSPRLARIGWPSSTISPPPHPLERAGLIKLVAARSADRPRQAPARVPAGRQVRR